MSFNHLKQFEARELAVRLLRRKLRAKAASSLSGVPLLEIRQLHRQLYGTCASSGQVPLSPTFAKTRMAQAMLSNFVTLYQRIGGEGIFKRLEVTDLERTFDLFHELKLGSYQFTEVWVIARDLISGQIQMKQCGLCRSHYVIVLEARTPPTCPFCALKQRRKRARRRTLSHA